jgi:hypothetical protein
MSDTSVTSAGHFAKTGASSDAEEDVNMFADHAVESAPLSSDGHDNYITSKFKMDIKFGPHIMSGKSADHAVETNTFSGAVQDSYTSFDLTAETDAFSSADHDANT